LGFFEENQGFLRIRALFVGEWGSFCGRMGLFLKERHEVLCIEYCILIVATLYQVLLGTLQHSATHYNRVQHTATHCNTLTERKRERKREKERERERRERVRERERDREKERQREGERERKHVCECTCAYVRVCECACACIYVFT